MTSGDIFSAMLICLKGQCGFLLLLRCTIALLGWFGFIFILYCQFNYKYRQAASMAIKHSSSKKQAPLPFKQQGYLRNHWSLLKIGYHCNFEKGRCVSVHGPLKTLFCPSKNKCFCWSFIVLFRSGCHIHDKSGFLYREYSFLSVLFASFVDFTRLWKNCRLHIAGIFEIFWEGILIQVFTYPGQAVAWAAPCNCISDSNLYARKGLWWSFLIFEGLILPP